MKIHKYTFGSTLALIIGSIYFYPWAFLWGYIGIYNPFHDYILELARNGMPVAYRVAVFIQDFFINLILMLPLALIILRIRPVGSWIYIVLALIACEATEMFPVWTDLRSYFEVIGAFEYILFCLLAVGPALIDYWILKKWLQSPPNKKRNEMDAAKAAPIR